MSNGDSERSEAGLHASERWASWQSDVRRVGDVVYRAASPWSTSVLALLAHLEERGCVASPRLIGSGISAAGEETVSFIIGESLQPRPWSSEALHGVGELLADLHDKAATFEDPPESQWQDWFGRLLGDPTRGFGHGDLGPWNIMAVEGMPTGFIDWDTAGPIDPVWEVAQAAWLNVQLQDDDLAEKLGLGDAAHRSGQLAVFLDGYGLTRQDRVGFVDKMIEVAVRSAANEAIEHQITDATTTGVASSGYPFAWGMAWRIRGARWMLHHRSTLEAAIN